MKAPRVISVKHIIENMNERKLSWNELNDLACMPWEQIRFKCLINKMSWKPARYSQACDLEANISIMSIVIHEVVHKFWALIFGYCAGAMAVCEILNCSWSHWIWNSATDYQTDSSTLWIVLFLFIFVITPQTMYSFNHMSLRPVYSELQTPATYPRSIYWFN